MDVLKNKLLRPLLFSSFLTVAGCASTDAVDTENLSVSQEEFVDGIAKPIIELMAVSGDYYRDNATWPSSVSALQRFAEDKKKAFTTQNIRNWRMSESVETTDTTFQIVSPASLEASGYITTTWRLTQDKLKPDSVTLKPLSTFCVLRQQPDSIGDALLGLTASAIVRQPMPPPGNKLCFKPPIEDIKVRRKQEQVEERLRLKLQQMQQQRQESENQSSN